MYGTVMKLVVQLCGVPAKTGSVVNVETFIQVAVGLYQ